MKYKYDATRTYTLNGVTRSNSEEMDPSFTDLSGLHTVYNIMTEAQEGQSEAAIEQSNSLKNYAYYVLREKIEEAANAGLSYVDLTWNDLIQQYSTANYIQFLNLTVTSNGTYAPWPDPQQEPTGSPWCEIMDDMNRSTQNTNWFSVHYNYKKNETVPYGVRLSWAAKQYDDTSSNTDWADAEQTHARFIVADNANTIISASAAATATSGNGAAELMVIAEFLDTCHKKIKGVLTQDTQSVKMFWEDFGNAYKDSVRQLMGVNADRTTYNNTKTITVTSPFTIYLDEISSNATSYTYAANSPFKLTNTLTRAGYTTAILYHPINKTYDGFVIAWGSTNASTIAAQYTSANTAPVSDPTIYFDVPTGAQMNTESNRITRANNTRQLQSLVQLIGSNLIAAFGANEHAIGLLWKQADGALPKAFKQRWQRNSGVLKFSEDIKRKNADGTITPLIDKETGIKDYQAALVSIFGTMTYAGHTTTVNTTGSKAENITASVPSLTGLNANTYYWDYLYYADHFATYSVKDGKTTWTLKPNGGNVNNGSSQPTATPSDACGIVIQVGTSGDAMDTIIKEMATTIAPKT